MISYAGVSLPVQTAEAAALIERYISVRDLQLFRPQQLSKDRLTWSEQGSDPQIRPIKIGSLYWPRGTCRWAVGHFLVDGDSLTQIRTAVYSPNYQDANLIMNDGAGGTITASMWMLPPYPLLGIDGLNGLFLLTLVDQRYFLWEGQEISILPAESGIGWSSYYQKIGQAIDLTIAADLVNSTYLNPSDGLKAYDQRIPPLLDSVAYNVGQRIVFDLDGAVAAQGIANAQKQYDANLNLGASLLAGGELEVSDPDSEDVVSLLPRYLVFTFPNGDRPTSSAFYAPGDYTGYQYYAPGYDPLAIVTHVTIDATTLGLPFNLSLSENSRLIRDSAYALYTKSTTPATWDNQAECQNLAKQFATDWYSFHAASANLVYAGIVPWVPEGLSDSIEWTYRENMVCTRIQRPSLNDPVEDLYHINPNTVPVAYPPFAWVTVTSQQTPPTGPYTGTIPNGGEVPYPRQGSAVQITAGGYKLDIGSSYYCRYEGYLSGGVAQYEVVSRPITDTSHGGTGYVLQLLAGDATQVISWTHSSNGIVGTDQFVVAAASAAQWGVVSTTSQTFAGDKTFLGNVFAQSLTTVGGVTCGSGSAVLADNYKGTGTTGQPATIQIAGPDIVLTSGSTTNPVSVTVTSALYSGGPPGIQIGQSGGPATAIQVIDSTGAQVTGFTGTSSGLGFTAGLFTSGSVQLTSLDGGTW